MIAMAVTLSIKFYTGFWSAAYAFLVAYHNFKG
jgi:hypothetical protein